MSDTDFTTHHLQPSNSREVGMKRVPAFMVVVMVLMGAFGLGLLGCAPEPMHEGRPVHYWRQQLKKGDYMTRYRACLAFSMIGPGGKEAVPDIIPCLHDEHYMVRQQASQAILKIGPDAKAAVPDLVQLLKDPNTHVRQAAKEALKRVDYEAFAEATKGQSDDE